jgi:signal transduction histidine kinase
MLTTAMEPRTALPALTRMRAPARRVPVRVRAHRRCPPPPRDGCSGGRPAIVAQLEVRRERARIARELHDGVAQTLFALRLGLGTLREVREADQLERQIDRVRRLADAAHLELRARLADLWADEPVPGGLTPALRGLAAAHRASQGAEVRLALGPEPDLPPATSAALVGIAREALHNVAKHAGAAHVDLVLEVGAAAVTLRIADDGRGFDPAAPRPGHFGLRAMRERAESVGASLEVTSAAGQGTRIRVRVPHERQEGR